MNTQFSLNNRHLTLVRYPQEKQHKSLQAWDGADELLIDYVEQNIAPQLHSKCIIFNDDFGALGCWFADRSPVWLSDSHISHRSLAVNLAQNGHDVQVSDQRVTAPVSAHSVMTPLPASPQLVLIRVPRTLALLEHQLIQLAGVMTPDTVIVATGKVRSVTSSVLALFEKYIGTTRTSLAKKKSRLIFATPGKAQTLSSPYPTTWQCSLTSGRTVTMHNHANVFSRTSLDIGARFMLEHMQIRPSDTLIDLGCGNGVLGLSALDMAPGTEVHFVDESYMALASARESVSRNLPEQLDDCTFHISNCLESLLKTHANSVNKVICNPPFHQHNTITDHIAWQMFSESRQLLTRGGQLIVVGNRHLDYHTKLKRLFGGVKVLASHNKFVILGAAKR
ncbi:methyltransferase [Alteromonas halophila]|uniref:Ribosomal RNA large subunit methyltransferase G n=1 Tax=Alteromonas halophila TaxID=516698 RepID=A0A918MX27_9ALTE|nr:methyltransferase [Alteromonas halophila]GGW80278.1 ribosomal RNA large subunit methyltransferase G [Alteromonas halophila]